MIVPEVSCEELLDISEDEVVSLQNKYEQALNELDALCEQGKTEATMRKNLVIERNKYREALENTMLAWGDLPAGHHRIEVAQTWLLDSMEPAMSKNRKVLLKDK